MLYHLLWLKHGGIDEPLIRDLCDLPNFQLDEKIGYSLLNGSIEILVKDFAMVSGFVLVGDLFFMPIPSSSFPIYLTIQLHKFVAGYIRVINDLTSGRAKVTQALFLIGVALSPLSKK